MSRDIRTGLGISWDRSQFELSRDIPSDDLFCSILGYPGIFWDKSSKLGHPRLSWDMSSFVSDYRCIQV